MCLVYFASRSAFVRKYIDCRNINSRSHIQIRVDERLSCATYTGPSDMSKELYLAVC